MSTNMCDFTLKDFELLKQEDSVAYKKFFKLTYQSTVKTLLSKGASLDDAKNCFQDAVLKFVYLVRAEKVQYESCVKLKGYVYKVAWRVFLALSNRKGNPPKAVSPNMASEDKDVLISEEERIAKERKQKIVVAALKKMPEPCRGILTDTIVKSIKPKYLIEKYNLKNANSFKDKKSRCLKQLKILVSRLF